MVLDTNYFHEYDREMGHYFSLNFKNNCSWTKIILFVHKFKEKKSNLKIRIKSVVLDKNYFHEYEMGHYFSLKFSNNCSWTKIIILFVRKFEEKKTNLKIRVKSVVLDANYFHEYEMGHYFSLKFTNNCSWTEIILLFVHKFKEKKLTLK